MGQMLSPLSSSLFLCIIPYLDDEESQRGKERRRALVKIWSFTAILTLRIHLRYSVSRLLLGGRICSACNSTSVADKYRDKNKGRRTDNISELVLMYMYLTHEQA